MSTFRLLAKAMVLAVVLGSLWGAFSFVASRESMAHGIQAAWILGAIMLVVVPVLVIFLRRAGRQIPPPRLNAILVVGGLLSIAQGLVVGGFTSPLWGLVGGAVMFFFFLIGAPLSWFLLRNEVEKRERASGG